MKLRKLIAVAALFAATSFLASTAFADTFNFSFGTLNSNLYGTGTLTGSLTGNTTSDGAPIYKITGVTGFTQLYPFTPVQSITNILAPGTFPVGPFSNDNLLTDPAGFFGIPKDTYLDLQGISYELADGLFVNISGSNIEDSGYNFTFFRQDGSQITDFNFEPITITDTTPVVPEPPSLLLLGTGLFGLAFLLFRRKFAEPVSHATMSA